MMDKLNIEKSIISISTPGVHLKPGLDEHAADLARKVNSFAANLKKRHPTRFGYFATLPLPAVAASLKEIETSYAEGCDGVCVETNHHGIYLGDERFNEVFADLDKRKAKVFIHPTTPCFCPTGTLGAGTTDIYKVNPLKERMPAPVLEFFFDTARCVANLFLSGTISRYPNITYFVCHMGGAMPPTLSRFLGFGNIVSGYDVEKWTEDEALKVLKERFYFDMAGWSFPIQWKGLVDSVGIDFGQLLYGSDFPFTPAKAVENFVQVMDKGTEGWKEEDIEKAYYGNAARLFGV